ncbi:MAG TPA: hypothetical protein VFE77_16020, partial [Rhodanobacter sp.]|nr:hypothetical protein [Rhodanobacter sp.]
MKTAVQQSAQAKQMEDAAGGRLRQNSLIDATIFTVLGGFRLLGNQDNLGDTFWRSLGSMVGASLVALGGKLIFQRERPPQDASADDFFKRTKYQGFRKRL